MKDSLERWLGDNNIKYVLLKHQAVFTVPEAKVHCGHIPGTHCKNLFLKNKKSGQLYLVTIPSEKRLDLNQFRRLIGAPKVRFAGLEELSEILGITAGAVSPINLVNDINNKVIFIVDKNVWIILGLMLIVAAFNMISGLLIMILDRTNMIGILKAIGSENRTVRRIILYQATYLMIKGLFWGNLIGIAICWIQHYFKVIRLDQSSYFIDYVPINFNIMYFILLSIGTLILTFLILLLPSMIISKISPVKTIRFN